MYATSKTSYAEIYEKHSGTKVSNVPRLGTYCTCLSYRKCVNVNNWFLYNVVIPVERL